MLINVQAGWIWFLLGCLAGVIPGIFFHNRDWLGGYISWPRRMIRLAHISFFGLGALNLAFGLTARELGIDANMGVVSVLLMTSAVTMPLVCYLSAWRINLRLLFPIPALSATAGVALFTWRIMWL